MFQIFEPAYTLVDARLSDFLTDGLGNVIAAVQGPLLLALVLYIVLYGYAILRGSISEPVLDLIVRMVKLCFIYVVATTVAYNSYVTEPLFNDLPNWLAGAIGGGGGAATGVGHSFDQFLARGFELADRITDTATITDWSPLLVSFLVVIATVIATAVGFGIVMIAKVALAVLVALGPIFIACLVFEPTRSFFYGWLKQGVNYLILFALILTVFQLILSLVEGQWGNINAQADPEMGGVLFVALSILGAIFFLQTPNIAAGIAGGAAAGIGDFVNAAKSGAGAAMGAGAIAAKSGLKLGKGAAASMGGRQGGSVRNGHPRR